MAGLVHRGGGAAAPQYGLSVAFIRGAQFPGCSTIHFDPKPK